MRRTDLFRKVTGSTIIGRLFCARREWRWDATGRRHSASGRMVTMDDGIGERIRHVRGSLSQAEFSGRMAVHEQTLGKYERNVRLPDAAFLERLHRLFDCDINWLLTGKTNPAPPPPPPPAVSDAVLLAAIGAVEELLSSRQSRLAPGKKTQLILLIYRQLTAAGSSGQVDRTMLDGLITLAS